MTVYKRSLWVMLKGIIGAPFGGLVVYIALSFFVEDQRIVTGISAFICLLILYFSIVSESIRFELDNDGTFRYYKLGRVKHTFQLEDCLVGYHRRSEAGLLGDHNIDLQIVTEDGQETIIDCSPIGLRRFERMYESMKQYTNEEPEVMQAEPAQ
ncbi:hypothetical protein LJC63_09920 [Ruminococcaceae bacterium OttesenSCG-928-L11]|nr:hypothetical protein [Ruminococcaceae bacterium OttesenSCG-928-L11]